MKHTLPILTLFFLFFGASSASAIGPYTDNGNGTVYDQATGLTWQQATADVNGDNTITSGYYPTGDIATWEQALAYCEGLGNDWRLPNIRELKSLVDRTTYSPAIDSHFQCESYYYWSATTYAYNTNYAWVVDFDDGYDYYSSKASHHYVRCVRGGLSGSFGQFGSLEISVPATTQQPWTPFLVTIIARSGSGTVRTDLNGIVELSSNIGLTKPERVGLVSGRWSGNVTLYNPGTGSLGGEGLGLYGRSTPVSMGQSDSCTSSISGRVIDLRDDVVYNAKVQLLNPDNQVLSTKDTDLNGRYDFGDRPCGTYKLAISKDTETALIKDILAYASNQGACLISRLSINGGTRGTPVILVAGILESTKIRVGLYPVLSKKKGKQNLHLFMASQTGFAALKKHLEDDLNYTVFECPWDWRMTIDEAAETYLKPKISAALKHSTTGKVHIVAHSMGGLVVRALIQGSQNWADKIDRFAMVGTPNLGAVDPYYIWEGGNPKLIDDIKDTGSTQWVNFYTSTLGNLWQTYHHYPWDSFFHKAMRRFIHDKGPSLLELMDTGKFLNGSRKTTGGNWNARLAALNSDPHRFRMSANGSGGTIQTGLFVGYKKDTVTGITVKSPDPHAQLYQDGKPRFVQRLSAVKGPGDGTVPYASATWPASDGWARLLKKDTDKEHAKLVKGYVGEIASFIDNGIVAVAAPLAKAAAEKAAGTDTPQLSLRVDGTVRLDVTGPAGNHAGMDPDTGSPAEDIPGSSIAFNGDDGEVGIDNPADGIYQVVVFGSVNRDYALEIGFLKADGSIEHYSQQGYYGADRVTLQVEVHRGASPAVRVVPAAVAPKNLQADLAGGGGVETTLLSWSASTEPGVIGYNVYSISETDPYFTYLGNVSAGATSYAAGAAWSGDTTTPVMTYVVTALKADGSESFFSKPAANNDRDHDKLPDVDEADYGTDPASADTDNDGYSDYDEIYAGSDPLNAKSVPTAWRSFPWTMFLPAITGH